MTTIDHNWFNTHTNDAPGFHFNGAARRRACRAYHPEYASRIPVRLVDGRKPPKLIGEDGGWYTKGGTPIDHPGAYCRKGWSNAVYHVNTLEVVVGRDWRPER